MHVMWVTWLQGTGGLLHIAHLLYNIRANERGNLLYSIRMGVAEADMVAFNSIATVLFVLSISGGN